MKTEGFWSYEAARDAYDNADAKYYAKANDGFWYRGYDSGSGGVCWNGQRLQQVGNPKALGLSEDRHEAFKRGLVDVPVEAL